MSERNNHSTLSQVLSKKSHIFQPLEFEVHSAVSTEFKAYDVRLISIAGHPIREKLLLYAKAELEPGVTYSSIGEIIPQVQDPVLDVFPQKYPAKVYITEHVTELGRSSSLSARLNRLRARGLASLDDKLGEYSGLAKALVFSDNTAKQEWRERLSKSGVMHLVVVSGFHVWFLYFVAIQLLNLLLPRKVAEGAFIALILLFAALNNWAAPISRAIIMILVLILARWISRPVSKAQILAAAFFIITIISPLELFNAGFQFSFLSAGIIFFVRWQVPVFSMEARQKSHVADLIAKVVNMCSLAGVVALGIYPLTWLYFGKAGLNGIVGNLLGLPLIGLLVPLSMLMLILPGGSGFFKILKYSYMWGYDLFESWIGMTSRLPFYREGLALRPTLWIAFSFAVLSFFMWISGKKRSIRYAVVTAVLLILAFNLGPLLRGKDSLSIHVFNAGVADCSLIRLKSGENILVDTGNAYPARNQSTEEMDYSLPDSWASKKLLNWLYKNKINTLDYVLVTHMHMDHYGGLPTILRELEVRNIVVTDETSSHPLWQLWEAADYFASSTIHTITDTISLQIGDVRLKFLHPDRSYTTLNENNRSLVFRLDSGGQSYLFTGDIEEDAEHHILERYIDELDADYLKVAHHGSKTSSTREFIQAVTPKQAWVTSSIKNKYGFPHQEAIDILHRYNAEVSFTFNGSIVHRQKRD